MTDLKEKLRDYVETFNAGDEECYVQAVPNAQAYAWLAEQIPLLECPDTALEETYYFRWWTFRKHWKETADGHIVTEFLPAVQWAGPHNSINCATCHHIREGRWLRDDAGWMREYMRFWLEGKGDALSYSMWLASAVEDYCTLRGDETFAQACLEPLTALYERREAQSLRACGLFWSDDDRDGMEYSISGPGLRPTLNAYMYGDAAAIARIAARGRRADLACIYRAKAERLEAAIERLLWDGDFYRTLPCGRDEQPDGAERPPVAPEHRVRELIGYLPWYFGLAKLDHEAAFAQLMQPNGFLAPWGLTTAEQRHPRFMFRHEHECLWNGPVWPFATAQTLTAAARLLRESPETDAFTREDYYVLLRQYALAHRLRDGTQRFKPWIDEDMDPYTGEWIARASLKADRWNPKRGGYERGKDYNHSTFCDLVLDGLLGIHTDVQGHLCVDPLTPDSWPWFRVEGIRAAGQMWTVLYDRDGSRYGCGPGIHVLEQ